MALKTAVPFFMLKKITLKQIENKIEDLIMEIDAMRANPLIGHDYAKKVKELISWRNRRIRYGKIKKD